MANLSNINNKFLVTTGGNVGIGNTSPTLSTLTVGIGSTNNPSQICQLAGSGSGVYSVLSLTNTNGVAADNNGVGLDFHVNAAYSATGRIQLIHPTAQSGTTTNASMQFLTYGTVGGVTTFSPRMTIDYIGNVGIGTASPDNILTLQAAAGSMHQRFKEVSTTIGFIGGANGIISGHNGKLALRAEAGLVLSSQGNSADVVISSGNVGIGTASPSSKLSINGSQAAIDITRGNAGDSKWEFSSDSTAMYVSEMSTGTRDYIMTLKETTGNVGIGTTSPSANLHVQNTSTATLKVITTGTADASVNIQGYDAGVHIGDATNGLRWAIWNDGPSTSSSLKFGSYALGTWYNDGSQVVTMKSDGKVGIGTTSPGRKLTVTGDVTGDANNLLLSNENDTDGDSASIGFSMLSNNTYVKAGIFFQRITNQGRGDLIFANNNEVNGNNVGVANEIMSIKNTGAIEIKGTSTTLNGKAFITNTNSLMTVGSTQSSGVPKDMAFFNGSIRMTIQATTGNVGIGTTLPSAKLDIGDGDFKQLKVNGANRFCVFRFKNAQSSFNNPDIVLFSNTTATGSYPQVSVHIKMHGRGFSANYSQFTEALATVELSTALIGLRSSIINHTTLGSAVSAGVFSISGTSLRFTPNRQTNYDSFSIEVNINSISVTYDT